MVVDSKTRDIQTKRDLRLYFRRLIWTQAFEYFEFRCLNRNKPYETLCTFYYRIPSFVTRMVLGSQEARSW